MATKHLGNDVDWGQLIDAARSGDELALAELYEQLSGYLWLTADRGLAADLRSKLAASDIVQQTLIDAHAQFDRFEGTTKKEIRAWLRAILKNNLTDAARRYRRSQSRDTARERPLQANGNACQLASRELTGSVYLRRLETDAELAGAVAMLPPRRRRVIELRYKDGSSYQEIAAELKITEVAARKLWSRAIQQLRTLLSEPDDERPRKAR